MLTRCDGEAVTHEHGGDLRGAWAEGIVRRALKRPCRTGPTIDFRVSDGVSVGPCLQERAGVCPIRVAPEILFVPPNRFLVGVGCREVRLDGGFRGRGLRGRRLWRVAVEPLDVPKLVRAHAHGSRPHPRAEEL